ncbi:hypothetical protein GGH92_008572, partial [Coemansia sp. RSA 2673]
MDDRRAYVSKNQQLAVAVTAQIPGALLRLLLDSNSDKGGTTGVCPYGDELARALYAPSMCGRYLAVAHAARFMLLERPEDSGSEYRLVSVGEASAPDETITALLCMGVFVPQQPLRQQHQQRSQSLCVSLIRIRQRMPVQTAGFSEAGDMRYASGSSGSTGNIGRRNAGLMAEDTEEVCLTFADGTVVSVDGRSLYLALRLCLSEALDGGTDEPVFQYKKWAFELNEPRVSDAVSYGPTAHRDPLAALAKSALTSSPLLADATARFLVAPQCGDAAFGVFMTNEDAATSVSAVDIAGRVAARVTGAVLSMARSYFWRGGARDTGSPDPGGRDAADRGSDGTAVPCVLAVRDSPRKVLDISLAPPSYGLAALTDSIGRILLFDLESCEAVHMLKGQRGSQCAWLECGSEPGRRRWQQRRMFVVVYTSRRGSVEVFELGSLERPLASVGIGSGWRLVQCPAQPLGGSLPVGATAGRARRAAL